MRKAETGKDGSALLRMPAVGSWRVRASARGCRPSEAEGVVISANAITAVALPLAAENEEAPTGRA